MAATPEKLVKAKIKDILKTHNAYYVMPIGTGYGNSGVPDFICCVNGQFLAIEAKAGDNKPTALQTQNLLRIKNAGGIAMVVNEENIEDLRAIIENYSKGVI
jgi:pantoate kinase